MHIIPQRPGMEVFYSCCIFSLLVPFSFTFQPLIPTLFQIHYQLGYGSDVCLHPLFHLTFPMTPSYPSSLQLLCLLQLAKRHQLLTACPSCRKSPGHVPLNLRHACMTSTSGSTKATFSSPSHHPCCQPIHRSLEHPIHPI